MIETLEQIPPEEVDENKNEVDIAHTAALAAQEMESILKSQKGDSVTNINHVIRYLRENGQENDLDTADFLKKFARDPHTVRMQYPERSAQAFQSLKSLSYFESMKEK